MTAIRKALASGFNGSGDGDDPVKALLVRAGEKHYGIFYDKLYPEEHKREAHRRLFDRVKNIKLSYKALCDIEATAGEENYKLIFEGFTQANPGVDLNEWLVQQRAEFSQVIKAPFGQKTLG